MTSAFSAAERAAALAVGVAGVLIAGLQPQLLGALAVEGRVDEQLLGHVATAELLAMGVAAGGAGLVLPVARLRLTAAAAIGIAALLDLLTRGSAGAMLVMIRALAGLAEGVLIWIAIGLIVRSPDPARMSGLYLGIQTMAQFAVATLISLGGSGARSGFGALAVATLAGAAALPWLPRRFPPLDRVAGEGSTRVPGRGLVALASVVIYMAFVVSVWVYAEPLARERGLGAGAVALVAPLSLAMQVVGAGVAALLAARLPALPTLFAAGVANLVLLAVMAVATSPLVVAAAMAVFGFLWLFALPFQVPMVIAADPSRHAAALIGGAQMIGAAAGPFMAALLLGGGTVTPVLWFGAGCVGVALLLLIMARVPGSGLASRP